MRKFSYLVVLTFLCTTTFADTIEERVSKMEKMLEQLKEELNAKDETIQNLKTQVNELNTAKKQSTKLSDNEILDSLIQDNHKESVKFINTPKEHEHKPLLELGDGAKALTDSLNISATFNSAVGSSSAKNSELEEYQGGAHDPNKKGFTFQQVELAIGGTIDNLFDLETYTVLTEDEIELEEAYITTRSLPHNLQVKAGYYLTEFGIINSQHLHAQEFIDQPFIATRMFGSEGMRDTGARLSWIAPLPWYSELILGVQNSDGDRMISFNGTGHEHGEDEHEDEGFDETIGGRPYNRDENSDNLVWSSRWINTFDLSENTTLQTGLSNLFGKNNTGGNTWIYGLDFKLVVDNPELQRPEWIWQTEIMKRQYKADSVDIELDDPADNFSYGSDTMEDWGFYTQLIKALDKKWSVGLRYEYASGSGDSFEGAESVDRNDDFARSDRYRISPLIGYQYSEYTKFRLQYNYDNSEAIGSANMIWFGVEVVLGSHPAHKF